MCSSDLGTIKFLNTLGQGLGTFGTATASTLATLASLPYAALHEGLTEGDQDTMDDILNNPVVKGVSAFDNYLRTELLPTYYTQDQQNRIFSAATGTDLINGVGFLASAIVPNSLIQKGLGSLSKAVALARVGKLTETLEEAVKVGTYTQEEASRIGSLANAMNKTGEITGAVISRIGESAMEANDTYDQLIAQGISEDKAKEMRDKVFGGNMLLAVSDFYQASRWFHGGSLADDIIKKGAKYAVKQRGFGELAADILKESAQEAGEEGFQYMLQQGAKKAALGKDFTESVLDSTGDLFTTTEGIKSMLLGAVLGGGASAVFGAMNAKQKNAALNQAVNDLNSNPTFKDRYVINDEGKRVINPEFANSMTDFAFYEAKKAEALKNNDKEAYDIAEQAQFANLVASRKRAGKLDDFLEEINSLKNTKPEEIESMLEIGRAHV